MYGNGMVKKLPLDVKNEKLAWHLNFKGGFARLGSHCELALVLLGGIIFFSENDIS